MTNFFQKYLASAKTPLPKISGLKKKPEEKKEESQDFVQKTLDQEQEQEKEQNNWLEAEGQLVLDVFRKEDNLIIRAPIAGVKSEDIDITIENDFISIKGERKKQEEKKEDCFFYKECYWGKFSREIVLPCEVDSQRAKADMKEGVLIISLPIIERKENKKLEIKE